MPHLNRIYYDLKIMDEACHRRLTGQSNRPVLAHLRQLLQDATIPVHVRVPLVPGMTATAENLAAIGQFLREQGIAEVTLLPYNPLWQDKVAKSDIKLHCGFMSSEQLARCTVQVDAV